MKNRRDTIVPGAVFWHKNAARQRKVVKVSDEKVCYHDGLGYGFCSVAHFMSMCPREVEITKRDWEVAKKIAEGRYEVYQGTMNGVMIE